MHALHEWGSLESTIKRGEQMKLVGGFSHYAAGVRAVREVFPWNFKYLMQVRI